MLRSLCAIAVLVLGITAADAMIICDRFGCRQNAPQTAHAARGRVVSGKPAGCPRAWCGCWLARHMGMAGNRSLWLARNWTRVGRPAAGPAPGVIAVFRRGKGGHVGIIKAVPRAGVIELLSGNDGGRVRQRERSTRGVIAYRWMG